MRGVLLETVPVRLRLTTVTADADVRATRIVEKAMIFILGRGLA